MVEEDKKKKKAGQNKVRERHEGGERKEEGKRRDVVFIDGRVTENKLKKQINYRCCASI